MANDLMRYVFFIQRRCIVCSSRHVKKKNASPEKNSRGVRSAEKKFSRAPEFVSEMAAPKNANRPQILINTMFVGRAAVTWRVNTICIQTGHLLPRRQTVSTSKKVKKSPWPANSRASNKKCTRLLTAQLV